MYSSPMMIVYGEELMLGKVIVKINEYIQNMYFGRVKEKDGNTKR